MASTPFRLDGKIAVVTGGSQGIGRAASLALAAAGATIAVTNLPARRNDVDGLVNEITRGGGTARGFDLDVDSITGIPAAFEKVSTDLGLVDILVNNAGVRVVKPALEVSESDWDFVLGVNLKGAFFCAQTAASHMMAKGGRIINIASQLAVSAFPGRAPYIASKGGLVALTRALAVEWGPFGITVNSVGPGPTSTPMTAGAKRNDEATLLARSPLGRRLEVSEVTGAIVFLSSTEAGAVTGQHLLVDGGWTAG